MNSLNNRLESWGLIRLKTPFAFMLAVALTACVLNAHRTFAAEEITKSSKRPNFVFFLVDDLGWADLGCFGSQFHETPNIDRLAASGMRFTQAYAACPVCSPTRASILTGRHPVRVNITDWIPGKRASDADNPRFRHIDDRDNLALEEVTIAEHLKQMANYATYFLGKWHLGSEGHWPGDQGFDVNVGGHHKGSPPGGYYAPWNNPALEANFDGEYLTTRLTDEAVELIEGHDQASPFFLMLSYYNVHTPIQPDRRTIDHFAEKRDRQFDGETPSRSERDGTSRLRQDNAEYASMVAAVDRSVGRLLDCLEEQAIDDRTVTVFFSDNGGLCTLRRRVGPTCNLPLRSGKGWLYEGGIREPMIVRAPGVTKPGSISDGVVVSTDFFPTILSLAGLDLQPTLHADGQDIRPLLEGNAGQPRTFAWHYPHYHGSTWTPGAAIREGDWKLIEFYENDQVELYDLASDPGERHDLAAAKPTLTKRLRGQLKEWQTSMSAQMPVER